MTREEFKLELYKQIILQEDRPWRDREWWNREEKDIIEDMKISLAEADTYVKSIESLWDDEQVVYLWDK